jgi:pimeloyl-ACP methyl ester carboxylesterase
MSAEAVSPIPTYFRVFDAVRVRFAENRADSDITVLLLAPWPETLWAFRRVWRRVSAVGRVVAIDMPGFGHSDGRPELIAPDASGAFLARLIDEWALGSPPYRRSRRRNGSGALPRGEDAGASDELNDRGRRGPDRSGWRTQGHHRSAES